MTEQWLPVPEFPDYEVSTFGRVLSHKRGAHLLSPIDGEGKYLTVTLYRNGVPCVWRIHRLVALAFHGASPFDGAQVRHLDGDARNNRADNLAWGSASENQLDSLRHGTQWRARTTHCPLGHEYTQGNTLWEETRRRCRTCRLEQRRARRSRQRAVA